MLLTASLARRWLTTALARLADRRAQVNKLNVFPVPDGDTGTNAILTLTAAARQAALVPEDDVGQLTAAAADGALRGARGNSGIILAQSLQALARTFHGHDTADAVLLVRAIDAIAQAAAGAIAQPVEGTIVTVARAAAAAVLELPPPLDLGEVVSHAQGAAHRALDQTAELLPILRGSGQVDAGALVYVVILDSLAAVLGVGEPTNPHWFDSVTHISEETGRHQFEVMYLVTASHREVTRLRQHLNQVGDSVVVVGNGAGLWHVHVHVKRPAQALPELAVRQVCVRTLVARAREVGLVAATSAPQLLEQLARGGAVAVLDPDPDLLVRAIQDTGRRNVVVLPDSDKSARAAQSAVADAALEDVSVDVASTRSSLAVLQAVAALEAFPELDSSSVRAICQDVPVLRLVGDDGRELDDTVDRIAAQIGEARPEVLTILVGSAVGAHRAARRLRDLVLSVSPTTESYVVLGGQGSPTLEVSTQ